MENNKKFSPPPHETETYKKLMKLKETGKIEYEEESDEDISEKWSEKYKHSIDCNNPKGFSQKAHCQGKKKREPKEQTMASSSGSFEPALSGPVYKRDFSSDKPKKVEATEQTAVGGGGGGFDYTVPAFGKTPKGGRKNPLAIEGTKSIAKSKAVTDKNFPKWGGPDSVFVKVKEKCKKFPYCNQGDINAIEPLKEAIETASKKYRLPISEVEKIVLNGIKQIFI